MFLYILLINVISFILFFVDKQKAKNRQWRISESKLLFFALIGGSLGEILGMKIFRHKTKTPKFYIGLPIILIVNFIFFYYLSRL